MPAAAVALAGTAVSSTLSASPMELGFGAVAVGDTSAPLKVTLTNISSQGVRIKAIESTDPRFTVDAGNALNTLASNDSTSFAVRFKADAAAPANTTVKVTLDGASAPELLVTASAVGVERKAVGGCGCSEVGSGGPLLLGLLAMLGSRLARRRRA